MKQFYRDLGAHKGTRASIEQAAQDFFGHDAEVSVTDAPGVVHVRVRVGWLSLRPTRKRADSANLLFRAVLPLGVYATLRVTLAWWRLR